MKMYETAQNQLSSPISAFMLNPEKGIFQVVHFDPYPSMVVS